MLYKKQKSDLRVKSLLKCKKSFRERKTTKC